MIARDLLRLVRRRWYLVLAGMVITSVILWPAVNRPGVYWTQVNVVILSPTYDRFPNKLEDPQYSLSALAGLVVADFNGTDRPVPTASSDTTLFGTGLSTGTQVRLPNMGSQWKMIFPTPTIDVQVVEHSPEDVEREADRVIAALNTILQNRQDEYGVAAEWRATMISSPDPVSVYYVKGSRARALGAGALAGIGITIALVYRLDRFTASRRRPEVETSQGPSAPRRKLAQAAR